MTNVFFTDVNKNILKNSSLLRLPKKEKSVTIEKKKDLSCFNCL